MEDRRKDPRDLLDPYEAREVFRWPRPGDCFIEGGKIFVALFGWEDVRPLEDSDFFLSFARLGARGEPSETMIRRWILKYGLPSPQPGDTWGSGPTRGVMSLRGFREEVNRARELLYFYAEIDTRNLTAIRAKVTDPNTPLDKQLSTAFRSSEYRQYKWWFVSSYVWSRGELDLFMARRVLGDIVTDLVPEVGLRSVAASPYSMTQSYHCPDLYSALYFQFYLLTIQDKRMRYCEHPTCGTPFPATRNNRRFCNKTCSSGARIYR